MVKAIFKLSALSSLILLAACGDGGDLSNGASGASGFGSSSDSGFGSSTPEPTPEPTYAISGTVEGLEGDIQLALNGENITISENGGFTFTQQYPSNTEVNVTVVSAPPLQYCRVDNNPQTISDADVSEIAVVCKYPGDFYGRVINHTSSALLSGVEVNFWRDGEQVKTVETDAEGKYAVDAIGADQRFVINTRHQDFAPHSQVVQNSYENDVLNINFGLLDYNNPRIATSLELSRGITTPLIVGEAELAVIQTGDFVHQDGSQPSGDIIAKLAIIDGSTDALLLPGNYLQKSDAMDERVESFGAVSIEAYDVEGSALKLQQGTSVTVNIPVALIHQNESLASELTVSRYDFSTGYWQPQGQGQLFADANGQQFYQFSANQLGTLSLNQAHTTVNIKGCVEDAIGDRLAFASVVAEGSGYIGASRVLADSNGEFSVPVKPNKTSFVYAQHGAESNTASVQVSSTDYNLANCLVVNDAAMTVRLSWGLEPSDLDSHFTGPTQSGRFHIDYTDTRVTVGDITSVLDVDDTTSFGPEVVTAPDFAEDGTYRYYVHNFTREFTDDIPMDSTTRVVVNLRGQIHTFTIPEGLQTNIWHVFDVTVSGDSATLSPVGEWLPDYQTGDEI